MVYIVNESQKKILAYLYKHPYDCHTIRVPYEATLDAIANGIYEGNQGKFGESIHSLKEQGLIIVKSTKVHNMPGKFIKCKLTDQGLAILHLMDPSLMKEPDRFFEIRLPIESITIEGDEIVARVEMEPKEFSEKLKYEVLKDKRPVVLDAVPRTVTDSSQRLLDDF